MDAQCLLFRLSTCPPANMWALTHALYKQRRLAWQKFQNILTSLFRCSFLSAERQLYQLRHSTIALLTNNRSSSMCGCVPALASACARITDCWEIRSHCLNLRWCRELMKEEGRSSQPCVRGLTCTILEFHLYGIYFVISCLIQCILYSSHES